MNLEVSNSEKISGVLEKQIEFLKTLNHMAKVKKCLKVKFDANNEPIQAHHENSSSNLLNEYYRNSLTNSVLKLCELTIKLINNKKFKELLDHLVVLIDEFDSEFFFDHLSRKISGDQQVDVTFLFETLLKEWLNCEDIQCKSLIHIVFLTFKHSKDDGKLIILDYLSKVN